MSETAQGESKPTTADSIRKLAALKETEQEGKVKTIDTSQIAQFIRWL
jgi:hypothetical protein